MTTYNVTLPIAGHALLTVEADSENGAIEKALSEVTFDHIDTWEPLEQFNHGFVCYCPRPWSAEAEAEDDYDEMEERA